MTEEEIKEVTNKLLQEINSEKNPPSPELIMSLVGEFFITMARISHSLERIAHELERRDG